MASFKANKKRLTIDLSFFVPHDYNIGSSTKSTNKSPKNFEPDDEVGLGIVAAMDELYQTLNPLSPAKSNRAAIFAVSPRSTTIPILNINNISVSSKSRGGGPKLEENMELSEEYTCVISHVGNNSIKKREYFDGNLANETESTNHCRVSSDHSGQFSACSPLPQGPKGSVVEAATQFCSAEFLNTCYLCKKRLHGLDIFMYRGEKAFCSTECRNKLISTDEHREKCGMQPVEYSVSPCSGQLQLFAGVAAA